MTSCLPNRLLAQSTRVVLASRSTPFAHHGSQIQCRKLSERAGSPKPVTKAATPVLRQSGRCRRQLHIRCLLCSLRVATPETKAGYEVRRRARLDPTRRNAHYADSLRAYLFGQALAVIGERRFRCGIDKSGLRQRHLPRIEVTCTITPDPFWIIAGRRARSRRTADIRLRLNSLFHSSSSSTANTRRPQSQKCGPA